MKKFLITSASALLLIGCFGGKNPIKNDVSCNIEGPNTPEWVCQPIVEGAIAEVGVGEVNAGNDFSFQRTMAINDARAKIARQIESRVKTMFKNFKATTGIGKDGTYDAAAEEVSKIVAKQTLRGSKPVKMWKAPGGRLYVLVAVPKEEVIESTKEAVKTSFKNRKALWQKFLAEKAYKKLDEEIEKEFGNANK